MAVTKKKTRTRAKPQHSDGGTDHDPPGRASNDHEVPWLTIGDLIYIKKTKGRKKASAKDLKALLEWVATQL